MRVGGKLHAFFYAYAPTHTKNWVGLMSRCYKIHPDGIKLQTPKTALPVKRKAVNAIQKSSGRGAGE